MATAWPVKQRELHNHHFDSTTWNAFPFRDNDVIVSTYAKSGTTWTQQIVGQLIYEGREDVPVHDLSPWMDLRVPPKEVKWDGLAAQTSRRFIKTHLPVDALVYSPKAKYLYIARDGRDVVWSLHNHHLNGNDLWYELLNDTPGRVGPPIPKCDPDIRAYYLNWFENDGAPFWSFWENVRSWWAIRDLPNLKLVHFADLKADMEGEIRAIADFLDIHPSKEAWPRILEHCSFDYMKTHANEVAPLGGAVFEGGGATFINKGANGRWRDVLTADDCARYDARARAELGDECAAWLANGSRAA